MTIYEPNDEVRRPGAEVDEFVDAPLVDGNDDDEEPRASLGREEPPPPGE